MATLRDQWLSDFVVADAGNLPVVPPDRWIVLVDGNRPVSAIAPATRLDPAGPVPAVVVPRQAVSDARLPQRAASFRPRLQLVSGRLMFGAAFGTVTGGLDRRFR